ncbi:MAG: spinster family MFS transporter [Hyphomonadaceae bacterium]
MAANTDSGAGAGEIAAGVAPPKVYGKGRTTWTLGLLCLIYANNFADRSILTVLAHPIKMDLKIDDTQLGLLTGLAFSVFYALFGYPLARLSDKVGRINIIMCCGLMWSAMTLLCGTAVNFIQLLIYRFGVGIGESGYAAPGHALLSDYFPPRTRTSAIAIFSMGVPIGALFGAIAGGWLAQHYGWREAFIFVSIPGFILAPLLKFTVKEPPRGNWDASRLAGKPIESPPPLWTVLKKQFSTPTFTHACIATVVAQFAISSTAFLGTYYVRRFELDLTTLGIVLGVLSGVASIVGTLGGGFISDWFAKFSKSWYAGLPALALALAAPLHILGYLQADWRVQVAYLAVSGALVSVYSVPFYGMTQNLIPARMRASGAAVIFFLINLLGLGFGPVFWGFVIDKSTQALFAAHGMGEYFATCGKGVLQVADAAVAKACHDSLSEATRWTLAASALGMLWASLHFYISSRTAARDLTEAERAN